LFFSDKSEDDVKFSKLVNLFFISICSSLNGEGISSVILVEDLIDVKLEILFLK